MTKEKVQLSVTSPNSLVFVQFTAGSYVCLFSNLLKLVFQLLLGSLPTSLIQYFSFWHFCYFINCYALKWQTARKQIDTKMKHSQISRTLASLLKVMKEEKIANDSSAESIARAQCWNSGILPRTISSTLLGGSLDRILPLNESCQHCNHHYSACGWQSS